MAFILMSVFFTRKGTKLILLLFLFLSFVPLLMGLLGSYKNNQTIKKALKRENYPIEVIEENKRMAKIPTKLGLYLSLPLILLEFIHIIRYNKSQKNK